MLVVLVKPTCVGGETTQIEPTEVVFNNICWQVLVMLLNVGCVGKTNMCWGETTLYANFACAKDANNTN